MVKDISCNLKEREIIRGWHCPEPSLTNYDQTAASVFRKDLLHTCLFPTGRERLRLRKREELIMSSLIKGRVLFLIRDLCSLTEAIIIFH